MSSSDREDVADEINGKISGNAEIMAAEKFRIENHHQSLTSPNNILSVSMEFRLSSH